MLTEKEAWELLARLWSKPQIDCGSECYIQIGVDWCYGLCGSVYDLWLYHQISDQTRRDMASKLDKTREDRSLLLMAFIWANDLKGAKERVEFCKTQGELC